MRTRTRSRTVWKSRNAGVTFYDKTIIPGLNFADGTDVGGVLRSPLIGSAWSLLGGIEEFGARAPASRPIAPTNAPLRLTFVRSGYQSPSCALLREGRGKEH
jgi:hypothetical protein